MGPPRNGAQPWQLGAIALGCLLFAVSAWIWHRRTQTESHEIAAAPLAPPATAPSHDDEPEKSLAPPEPASAETVQVRVSGVNGAQVYIDGLDVGRIPVELSLPSKVGYRTVSVRRAGYAAFTAVIAADDNAIVTARLRSIASHPKLSPGDIKDPFAH